MQRGLVQFHKTPNEANAILEKLAMGQGTGTAKCKLGHGRLKIVESKDGKTILEVNCRNNQYEMNDMALLVETGEIDAVDEEDENLDDDEDPDDEDEDLDDDQDLDDDEFDDDDDKDDEDDDDDDEGPTASKSTGEVTVTGESWP